MPRVIGDQLYDDLMKCVKDQRLLGVMGLLEKCKKEAREVEESDDTPVIQLGGRFYTEYRYIHLEEYIESEPTTNNN